MRKCQRMIPGGNGKKYQCNQQVINPDSIYCFYCEKVLSGLIKEGTVGETVPLLIMEEIDGTER